MAAGDINDPLSNIPNIALVDQSAASAAPGAGYARLEVVSGVLGLRAGAGAWVPLASLVAGLLTALDAKTTPIAGDLLLLQDSEDAGALKKLDIDNLPSGGPGGGLFDAYAIVSDTKAHGTAGGTFTAGSWQTHDLQTEDADPSGIVSLASNHMTLGAGTYYARGVATTRLVGHAQLRLRDTTNNVTLAVGTPNFTNVGHDSGSMLEVSGRFTLTGSANVELQGRCETTQATDGWMDMPDWDEPIAYALVTIWREA